MNVILATPAFSVTLLSHKTQKAIAYEPGDVKLAGDIRRVDRRKLAPRSQKAIEAVRMMKDGKNKTLIAKALGVTTASVDIWFLRHIVYPEWKAWSDEIEKDLAEAL